MQNLDQRLDQDGKHCNSKNLPKETREQIALRLKTVEANRTRQLLSQAMSFLEASKVTQDIITRRVLKENLKK